MKQTRRQFVRTLFVATQAAALGPGLTRKLFAAEPQTNALNFLLLGDWGREGEPDQAAVARQMGLCGEKLQPKFVVAVGDNFYENGVTSVKDAHWQKSFEKVYTAPALQVPWWAILGNHDYHGNCDAQIAYSKGSRRWNMPARYYRRTETINAATIGAAVTAKDSDARRGQAKNSVEFFYIDTTPMAGFDTGEKTLNNKLKSQNLPRQMEWLESALKDSTAAWKIVIGHHPVYSGGVHGDTPYIVKHVLPLLEEHGVQVYFNGHDHDLQHLQAGKVNLFCTGGGSKPRPAVKKTEHSKFGLGCSGFIAASLSVDALDVRMIDDTGKLLYRTCVPRGA